MSLSSPVRLCNLILKIASACFSLNPYILINPSLAVSTSGAFFISSTISSILATINSRAERTKANELKAVADNKAKAEKEVLDRIAKAEREAAEKARIEERNVRIAKEKEETILRESQYQQTTPVQVELSKEPVKVNVINKSVPTNTKKYFIEMRVENMTIDQVTILSEFLKSSGYEYNATKKGAM